MVSKLFLLRVFSDLSDGLDICRLFIFGIFVLVNVRDKAADELLIYVYPLPHLDLSIFFCHYSAECSLFRVAVHPSTYTGVDTIITTPTSGSSLQITKG